jgi:hypothetical protein
MAEHGHATVGDALIFFTKALLVVVLCILVLIGIISWQAMDQSDQINRLNLASRLQEARISKLGDHLNTCLAEAKGTNPVTEFLNRPDPVAPSE